jgi:sugar O-acyltransferase (sialic acid O-acetyltransferase NeuD family)
MNIVAVTIPLVNPNEPEALLAALHVSEGQRVASGDPVCTLETTKSSLEVTSETEGYISGLRFTAGQTVRAGELLCYVQDAYGASLPVEQAASQSPQGEAELPSGLRITQPALALARQLGLSLDILPVGDLVTESLVRRIAEQEKAPPTAAAQAGFDPTAIIVYGAGGHGKSLIELLRALGCYHLVGVIDDGVPVGSTVLGVPVLGGGEVLFGLAQEGVRLAVNAVGGIGDVSVRTRIFKRLADAGFACPAVVHPRAFVESSAILSPGAQVFPHAYLGSDVRLGFGTIANTGSIISHDCILGESVNISPGAILAGGVQVCDFALIGMGATINLMVRVGTGARIGNGATVKTDVPPGAVVRAGSIFPA